MLWFKHSRGTFMLVRLFWYKYSWGTFRVRLRTVNTLQDADSSEILPQS
jgi:hypothetical protein